MSKWIFCAVYLSAVLFAHYWEPKMPLPNCRPFTIGYSTVGNMAVFTDCRPTRKVCVFDGRGK